MGKIRELEWQIHYGCLHTMCTPISTFFCHKCFLPSYFVNVSTINLNSIHIENKMFKSKLCIGIYSKVMLSREQSNSAWYSWHISTWNFVTRLTNKEYICVWQILITLTKSQMKLSFPWWNLFKLWIVLKRKRIQAKDNNTSKSIEWPKLVVIWKWVFMSMTIFIKKFSI